MDNTLGQYLVYKPVTSQNQAFWKINYLFSIKKMKYWDLVSN